MSGSFEFSNEYIFLIDGFAQKQKPVSSNIGVNKPKIHFLLQLIIIKWIYLYNGCKSFAKINKFFRRVSDLLINFHMKKKLIDICVYSASETQPAFENEHQWLIKLNAPLSSIVSHLTWSIWLRFKKYCHRKICQ